MQPTSFFIRHFSPLALAAALALGVTSASAVTQYWSGVGIWNTGLNWGNASGGPYTVAWNNNTADIAVFEGTAGTVTIGANRNVDRLDFNVTGYSLTAAGPVLLTGNGGTNYNLAADVTADIESNVTLQSSATNQNWNIKGTNKSTSILNLSGTIKSTTSNSSSLLDCTVNLTGGQLIAGISIVTGTTTTGSGSELNISSGGSVTIANATSSLILNNTGGITANSSISISGGSITFTDAANTNGIRFGPTGAVTNPATSLTGTVNFDGGITTINKIFVGGTYSGGAVYYSYVNLNGGTLKALANQAAFMQGLTSVTVEANGAIFDSNGFNITVAQTLEAGTGSGGLEKKGSGTLTLSGNNTYVGATTVNAGTLAVTGSLHATSAVKVGGASASGSPTLTGTGTVNGSLTIAAAAGGAAGTVNPGSISGIGTLATGPANIAGTLAVDINASTSDKLAVNGNLDISAATLALNTLAPPAAASYELASYTGTLTGTTFATTTGLPTGYEVTIDTTQKKILLTPIPSSGYNTWAATYASGQTAELDFDNDGVSNGVEYFMGETSIGFTASPFPDNTGKIVWPKDPAFAGTWTVETSPDLEVWSPVSATDNGTSIEYTLPSGSPALFLHLVVTPD